jgi:hypothetical protein
MVAVEVEVADLPHRFLQDEGDGYSHREDGI